MFCKDCKEKKKCRNICPKLEKYLKSIGIYSAGYIRPSMSSQKRNNGYGRHREVPFSAINWDISQNFDHDK